MKKQIYISLIMLVAIASDMTGSPRKIRCKTDYTHTSTGMVFPLILKDYNRSEIYSFDKEVKNVGVNYENNQSTGKTKISIYVYPADKGMEDRLRSEYAVTLQSIANVSEKGLHAVQYAVSFKNSGYTINGYKADIKDIEQVSSMSLYECAHWFFKVRITSDNLDSTGMANTEQQMLLQFLPTNLVKNDPLAPKADVHFSKAAFTDSLMLGSAMGSAFAKIDWAFANVDSLERAAGFQGMYLGLHTAGLKGFVDFQKKHPTMSTTKRTTDYLSELNAIINSGFLNEFVLEQYNYVMITPKDLVVDIDAFDKWKEHHPLTIELRKMFYVIGFK